jgi:CDP-glycerol glycerophosphotransferase (TagB/SpsB family)
MKEKTKILLSNLKHLEAILKKIKYFPLYVIYFLSGFFKRNKNTWLFGTYNAGFGDNSKYLYLYLEKNYPEIEIIWITRKKNNLNYLQSKGINAYYKKSLKGVFSILRAGFIFSNTNIEDVSYWFSKGAKFVNLWHGVPLKKIEFDIESGKIAWKFQSSNNFIKMMKKLTFPGLYRHPDYLLIPSNYMKKYFISAFKIKDENVLLGEYPRNSIFKYPKNELLKLISRFESSVTFEFVKSFSKYEKIFVYLPTFRDGKSDFFKDSGIDFEQLDKIGKAKNYLFLIKLHPTTSKKIVDLEKFTNIKLLDSKTDIYPILPFTDILISDYSSIFFDYLLLNKEIIFFPFDLKEYMQKSRKMYFDYDEIVVGRKCISFSQLLQTIMNIESLDFSKERKNMLNKIWDEGNYSIDENVKFLLENE